METSPSARRVLVVMSGLPGSGKTTVARSLAGTLSLCLLVLDHLEAPILARGVDGAVIGWAGYDALAALADDNLGAGNSVIVDSVCWTNAIRSRWADLALRHGVEYRPMEMVCSETERSERIARRGTPAPHALGARALYEPWKSRRWVLDSSRPLADIIGEAVEYIRG